MMKMKFCISSIKTSQLIEGSNVDGLHQIFKASNLFAQVLHRDQVIYDGGDNLDHLDAEAAWRVNKVAKVEEWSDMKSYATGTNLWAPQTRPSISMLFTAFSIASRSA